MTRVALYMRCSTEEQATEGLSIEGQRSVLLSHCRAKGLEVAEEFVDEGRSGRYAGRPEFQRMIAAAKSKRPPWSAILVIKWDRFARSTEDATVYKSVLRNRCGIDVIAVQQPSEDTATGRMVEGIMDVLSEFYSANLAEDVHRGMREKAKGGAGALGKPPFGYRIADGDAWAVDQDEAAVVRHVFERYVAGDGMFAVMSYLHSPEAAARFGDAALRRKWSTRTVSVILSNPAYMGTRRWGMSRIVRIDGTLRHRPRPESQHVVVEAAHPAIIDQETWQAAQRLRETRAGRRRRTPEDYLLRGLLRCGDCGGPMSLNVQRTTRRPKNRPLRVDTYRTVVCNRYVHTGECSRQTMNYERLCALVLDEMRAAVGDPKELVFAPPAPGRSSERGGLEAKLREIPARIDRQVQAYEVGAISLEDLRTARERLRAEEEGLRRLLSAEPTKPDLLAFRARVDEALRIVESGADITTRRRALVGLISYISWSKTKQQLEIVWRSE